MRPKHGSSSTTSAAPLTIRVNRLKIDREALARALAGHGVGVEPARFAPDGLIVTIGNPLRTPLAGTGQFVLQDEASQLVALLGAPEAGHEGARYVRLSRRQDHGDGGDGRRSRRDRRDRRARRARATAARNRQRQRRAQHPRACRPISEAGLPFGRHSTWCSSTRRARASARCGGTRTFGGGGPRPISRRSRARS